MATKNTLEEIASFFSWIGSRLARTDNDTDTDSSGRISSWVLILFFFTVSSILFLPFCVLICKLKKDAKNGLEGHVTAANRPKKNPGLLTRLRKGKKVATAEQYIPSGLPPGFHKIRISDQKEQDVNGNVRA